MSTKQNRLREIEQEIRALETERKKLVADMADDCEHDWQYNYDHYLCTKCPADTPNLTSYYRRLKKEK